MAVGRLNPVAKDFVLEVTAVGDVDRHRRRQCRVAVDVARQRCERVNAIIDRSSVPAQRIGIGRVFDARRHAIDVKAHTADADIVSRVGRNRDDVMTCVPAAGASIEHLRRIGIGRNQLPERRRHIRLDLRLRERAIVNSDVVDPTGEIKPGGARSLADVNIGGRNLLRRLSPCPEELRHRVAR